MILAFAGKQSPFAESTAAPPPTPASPLTPASLAWSSRTGSLNPSQTSSRATSKAPSRAASLQSELLLSNGPPSACPGPLSKAYTGSSPPDCHVHEVMVIQLSKLLGGWPSLEEDATIFCLGGLYGMSMSGFGICVQSLQSGMFVVALLLSSLSAWNGFFEGVTLPMLC